MVRLKGPALSLAASGTAADAVTFSNWKGKSYLKRRSVPSNPNTPAQHVYRIYMTWLNTAWSTLSNSDKATWQPLATASDVAPFSAFLSENIKRWNNFKPPGKAYPIAGLANPPELWHGLFTVTGGVRCFTYTAALKQWGNAWGIEAHLHGEYELLYPNTKENVIDFRYQIGSATYTYHVRDMPPGSYILALECFSHGGTRRELTTRRPFIVYDYD